MTIALDKFTKDENDLFPMRHLCQAQLSGMDSCIGRCRQERSMRERWMQPKVQQQQHMCLTEVPQRLRHERVEYPMEDKIMDRNMTRYYRNCSTMVNLK